MLSESQINKIVQKLNAKIDIPIINERKEEKILENVLTKLDNKVAKELPPPLRDMWNKLDDGITEEEGAELAAKVTEIVNRKINIPLLNEKQEQKLISALVETIIEVAISRLPV